MSAKIRFDVLITGTSCPTPPKLSAVGWMWAAVGCATPPEPTHWRVRVTARPDEEKALGLPLVLGQYYDLPMSLFNYCTFLGDGVEIEWDGKEYSHPEPFQHGYQPTECSLRTHQEAMEALIALHTEIMGQTDNFPSQELAGRAIWAGHLLNRVMGEVSCPTRAPVDAGPVAMQVQAVRLCGQIFRKLGIDNLREVSKKWSGMAAGCREVVELSLDSRSPDSAIVDKAVWILRGSLVTDWPHRQPEVDSIANLLRMAAQADDNYGKGTGDRILDKVLGPDK